jgi:hypothetical protein
MTNWTEKLQAEQAFLRDLITEAEHKIERYTNALDSCHDCQEADSLRAMLQTAQGQRDLLNDLLAKQGALSLGSLLAEDIKHFENEAERLSERWQHGHTTAPEYWELENKRLFLIDIQRRYHAWETDRPYYLPTPANGTVKQPDAPNGQSRYEHPWYLPMPTHGQENGEREDDEQAVKTIQKKIGEVLHQQGFPDNHLKVTFQPDGSVFVVGYVHSKADRDRIFKIVCAVEGVREVLAGVQVVDEAHCPVCTGLL